MVGDACPPTDDSGMSSDVDGALILWFSQAGGPDPPPYEPRQHGKAALVVVQHGRHGLSGAFSRPFPPGLQGESEERSEGGGEYGIDHQTFRIAPLYFILSGAAPTGVSGGLRK